MAQEQSRKGQNRRHGFRFGTERVVDYVVLHGDPVAIGSRGAQMVGNGWEPFGAPVVVAGLMAQAFIMRGVILDAPGTVH